MHERTMWGYTKIFNKHLVYFLNFMKNYEANVLEFLENREKMLLLGIHKQLNA